MAAALLAFAGSAQAAHLYTSYGSYGEVVVGSQPTSNSAIRPVVPPAVGCAHAVTAKQGIGLAVAVWNPQRWKRGDPKPAVIAAHRRQVRCAAGPGHKAAIQRGWAIHRSRFYRHRHHCRSGYVVRGRVSVFGGGLTASGLIASSTPGLALNIAPGTDAGWDNSLTRSWVAARQRFRVTILGHSAILPVVDLGPAGFVGRAVDVTEPGAGVLGLSVSAFPTDSSGTAKLIPPGCG